MFAALLLDHEQKEVHPQFDPEGGAKANNSRLFVCPAFEVILHWLERSVTVFSGVTVFSVASKIQDNKLRKKNQDLRPYYNGLIY